MRVDIIIFICLPLVVIVISLEQEKALASGRNRQGGIQSSGIGTPRGQWSIRALPYLCEIRIIRIAKDLIG